MCVAKILSPSKNKGVLVLGADTIVVLNDEIIGKPSSPEDAFEMLKKLTGNVHEVYTGLCLYDFESDRLFTGVEKTLVSMISCSESRIRAYIASEHIMDKAGAYAVQGIGAAFLRGSGERAAGHRCYRHLPLSWSRKD